MKIVVGLGFLVLSGLGAQATAGDGPCGVSIGHWVTPTCEAPDPNFEANRLVFDHRTMVFYETVCSIRSATLIGKTCKMRLACEAEGEAELREDTFRIVDAQTIHYDRPDLDYRYCGKAEPTTE